MLWRSNSRLKPPQIHSWNPCKTWEGLRWAEDLVHWWDDEGEKGCEEPRLEKLLPERRSDVLNAKTGAFYNDQCDNLLEKWHRVVVAQGLVRQVHPQPGGSSAERECAGMRQMLFQCIFKTVLYISLLNPTALCLVPGTSLIKPIEWDFRTKKLSLSEQRQGLSNKATVGEKNWYLGTWSNNFPAENSPCLKAQGKLGYAAAGSPCTSFLRCLWERGWGFARSHLHGN